MLRGRWRKPAKTIARPRNLRRLLGGFAIAPAAGRPHGSPFPARLFPHQRQARVGVLPRGTDPDMLRIFGDGQGPRGARKEIKIVNIVTRSGDYRVKAAVYQHGLAIFDLQSLIGAVLPGIKVLHRKTVRLAEAVIINLIQIDFARRIVHVVLVGGPARPIPAGCINFNYHQLIRWKRGRDDVHNLPRGISAAAQAADDIAGRDQFRLQAGLGRCATFRELANSFRSENRLVSGWQIERVRQTGKHVFALSNPRGPLPPIHLAGAAEQNKGSFLVVGACAKDIAWLQTAYEEAHPFPSGLLARQRKQLTRGTLGQVDGMDEKASLAQVLSSAKRSHRIWPSGIVFV